MFSDPIVAVMAMLILCFSGIMVMFVFVIRSIAGQRDEMREAFRKQQMFMADLERQFMEMSFLLRKFQGEEESPQDPGTAKKSSHDMPILREDDDLMSMLESSGRQKSPPPYNDLLLQPASKPREAADDYDPTTDPHLFEDVFLAEPGSAYGARNTSRAGRDKSQTESGDTLSLLSLRRDE